MKRASVWGGGVLVAATWGGAVMLLSGCGDTGQSRVAVPLQLAGAEVQTPLLAAGDVPVSLTRADLAFGPLYLCPGTTAGELCNTARLEWLETAVVDTLSTEPLSAGELSGVTGPVQSWMYDLAISSQLTRQEPYVLEAAEELGGVSVILEGTAEVSAGSVLFRARVPLQQGEQAEQGVPVVRSAPGEVPQHDVTGAESGLLITFNAGPWISGVDFEALVESGTCTAAEGSAEGAQVCDVPEDSQAFRSIRNAVLAGESPEFEWQ